MKKYSSLLFAFLLTGLFTQCGPAAEDRFKMHETADHISDSIGKAIDIALAKGAIPNSTPVKADSTLTK